MKVTEVTRSESSLENYDYREKLEIKINGETAFDVSDGEPEDSNLSRDFGDCFSIINLMQKAYEAGKNGEDFEVDYVEED